MKKLFFLLTISLLIVAVTQATATQLTAKESKVAKDVPVLVQTSDAVMVVIFDGTGWIMKASPQQIAAVAENRTEEMSMKIWGTSLSPPSTIFSNNQEMLVQITKKKSGDTLTENYAMNSTSCRLAIYLSQQIRNLQAMNANSWTWTYNALNIVNGGDAERIKSSLSPISYSPICASDQNTEETFHYAAFVNKALIVATFKKTQPALEKVI